MNAKQTVGIVMTVLAVLVEIPLCVFALGGGFLVLAHAESVFMLASAGLLLSIPFFCVESTLLSVIFILKKQYVLSYIIHALPFRILGIGLYWMWLF